VNRTLCLLLLMVLEAQATDTYRLDAIHTQVSFDVRRFGILWFTAHFRDVSGSFVIDREGSESRVDVAVQTDSVECPDPRWTARLRSKEWLDTQRFPEMTYRSIQVEFDGAGRAIASGQLTLHGVTRPVTLNVSQLDCSNQPSGSTGYCGFVAHAHIKRSDFNLPHGFWQAGDRVEISISGSAKTGGASDSPPAVGPAAVLGGSMRAPRWRAPVRSFMNRGAGTASIRADIFQTPGPSSNG
jgi:polyisoprenoid-binding protein YceI